MPLLPQGMREPPACDAARYWRAMSRRSVEGVRQPIRVRAPSGRTLAERVFVRFPRVGLALARAVLRRPPESGVRRAAVARFSRAIFEAANRGDYQACFALLAPDFEMISPPELVDVGFDPVYHGREGRMRMQLTWMGELGEFRQEPEEVVDLGDRILLLARMTFRGRTSSVGLDSEVSYVLTIVDGRIVREHNFRSHREGLEAAGLAG